MESFTLCGNGNGCGNIATIKWVPTLFCATVAVAKYFALTLHYCTLNTFSNNAMKITAAAAPCERTFKVKLISEIKYFFVCKYNLMDL